MPLSLVFLQIFFSIYFSFLFWYWKTYLTIPLLSFGTVHSLVQITLIQSWIVKCLYHVAYSRCFFVCALVNNAHLTADHFWILSSWRWWQPVLIEICWFIISYKTELGIKVLSKAVWTIYICLLKLISFKAIQSRLIYMSIVGFENIWEMTQLYEKEYTIPDQFSPMTSLVYALQEYVLCQFLWASDGGF